MTVGNCIQIDLLICEICLYNETILIYFVRVSNLHALSSSI